MIVEGEQMFVSSRLGHTNRRDAAKVYSFTFYITHPTIATSNACINNHLWSFDAQPILLNSNCNFLHSETIIRPIRPFHLYFFYFDNRPNEKGELGLLKPPFLELLQGQALEYCHSE